MKVLEVVSSPYPVVVDNGPGRVIFEVSRRLGQRGRRIDLLALNMSNQGQVVVPSSFGVSGVVQLKNPARRFPSSLGSLRIDSMRVFSPYVLSVSDIVEDYDLVHIHEMWSPLAVMTGAACRNRGIPFVVSAHGCLTQGISYDRTKNVLWPLLVDPIMREATAFHALTLFELNQYVRRGWPRSKVTVIPNGVPIRLSESSKQSAFTKSAGEVFKILYLGRLCRKKGLDVLLQAVGRLASVSETRIELTAAGRIEESYLGEINHLIDSLGLRSIVKLMGYVDEATKEMLYSNAHVYALPSRDEGMPLSVLEAASFGVPLCISENCHIPEVLEYKAGCISSLDPREMAESLASIQRDDMWDEARRGALRMVGDVFSWERVADRYELLYETTLASIE